LVWNLKVDHAYIKKPYPDYFDATPYPRGFKIPDFVKFTGDDGRSTFEHIGQFLAQCSEVGTSDVYRVKLTPLSLIFIWYCIHMVCISCS
jgi:hypothetical protein